MIVLQYSLKPFEIAVSAIDLTVQLRQLNLVCDVISAEKSSFNLFVAHYVQIYRSKSEFIDFLNALSCFDVKVHVTIVNRQSTYL